MQKEIYQFHKQKSIGIDKITENTTLIYQQNPNLKGDYMTDRISELKEENNSEL